MPSQADALTMPTTQEAPLLDATHPARRPAKPAWKYAAPKLPFDAPKAEE